MEGHNVTHIRVSSLRQNTDRNLTDTGIEHDKAFLECIRNTETTISPLTLGQAEEIKLAVMNRYGIAELAKKYNVSMLTICECLLQ